MSTAYTEAQLVEQPAVGLFAELGWQTVVALEEVFGPASTLQRETPARWSWCNAYARLWSG